MIIGFLTKIKDFIKYKIPVYDFNVEEKGSDKHRSRRNLINDIQGKRIVLNKLSRKLAMSFYTTILLLVILISYVAVNSHGLYENRRENRVKVNREVIGVRVDIEILSDNLSTIEYTELKAAINLIQEKKFSRALKFLAKSTNEEAIWLRAFCYMQLSEHNKAKTELQQLVKLNGKLSSRAKEFLTDYYEY